MTKSSSLFIYVVLLTSFISCEDASLLNQLDACVTKLAKCELDDKEHELIGRPGERGDPGPSGIDGLPGHKGPPGNAGEIGEPGDSGRSGIPGTQGAIGQPGIPGPKGVKGDVGDWGPRGPQGISGTDGMNGLDGKKGADGARGPVGDQGLRGFDGPIGLKGIKGPRGNKGDQGSPGVPATCGCKYEGAVAEDGLKSDMSEDAKIEWGTLRFPGNVTCRKAPLSDSDEEKIYYLYLGPMTVSCDSKTKHTCIKKLNEKNITYEYTSLEPFWLSETGVSIEDIYNLKADQLSWLQSESYTANMTIRFHCLNSNPAGNASTDAMKLLTWNGLLIGPKATTASPFHYEIVNDGCSTAERDVWGITDIELVSPIADRLPIFDFFISDVRKNVKQALRVQITRLCFY